MGRTRERPDAHTVYLGGGTPSILSAHQLGRILEAVRSAFALSEDAEITMEANPTPAGRIDFQAARGLGVTRLSVGAQSAQQADLRLFNRGHDWDDVVLAVKEARRAGFENVNLDLIYGAPGQTLASWRCTLRRALELAPEHLSLYALSVEPDTAMDAWLERGELNRPDPDLAADMYEYASEVLPQAGLQQYEISNWARPGYTCRHNLQYWRYRPYLGFGAGAHGFVDALRYDVVRSPREYIDRLDGPPEWREKRHRFLLSPAVNLAGVEPVSEAQARSESLFLGLRLTTEGVSRTWFVQRFGEPVETYFGPELERLSGWGLIDIHPDRIVLTPQGRLVANQVFSFFV